MKRQLGALAGALYLSAGTLAAAADFEDYARVVRVTPQIEEANQPERECPAEHAGTDQPVRRCHTVDHWHTRVDGYAVTYEYQGQSYTSTIPYDPGDRLKVHVSIAPDM